MCQENLRGKTMRKRARMVVSRAFPFLALPVVIVLLATPGQAQSIVLDPPPFTTPANTLSLGDVDFLNSTTPRWLFTINLRNTTSNTVSIRLRISLDVNLANGQNFAMAIVLRTTPFDVSPSGRTVTNLDMGRTRAIPEEEYTVNATARRAFEDLALPGGTMPAGIYRFIVEVLPVDGSQGNSGGFEIRLTNPSSVRLLAPVDGDLFTSQFPLFQWQYDGRRSEISIFEKLEGQSSLEEAANGIPHLRTTVETNSFQYPNSGVRNLQPGKTYVWYVEGLATTSGGTSIGTRSPLRYFRVAEQGATQSVSSLLDELERALGPNYKGVFDQIRADGLSPSGTMRLNGATLSTSDLQQLLNQIRRNPDLVSSVVLE
jgi:hypothetical protein